MRRTPLFRLITVVVLISFSTACLPTKVSPISAQGAAFQPERDEKELWQESQAEESKLLEKAKVYRDPLLTDYLQGVVQRLNPPGLAANPQVAFRVTVLEEPTLNAFAYPTGSLFIHTGLLARMANEDQLATVLGHEMTHVENRHMLTYQRRAQNRRIAFSVLAIAGAIAAATQEGHAVKDGDYGKAAAIGVLSQLMLGLGLQLAFLASVNGYGRELERDADEGGMAKLVAAGYDVREAPKVFNLLKQEREDPGKLEVFFFGSHPRLKERIENTEAWIAAHPSSPAASDPDPQNDFERRIRSVVRDDAKLNIAAGRYKLAAEQLERARALLPTDPVTHLLIGRLHLAEASKAKEPAQVTESRQKAQAAFQEAIRLDDTLAAAHRELGLMAYRDQNYPTACTEFARFLELDPKSEDAPSVRDYRLELERDGRCSP